MLQIKDLTMHHRKDLRELVGGLSFSLNKGDKAVLIGEEGNGKSTILKWIYDENLVSDYIDVNGQKICVGEKLSYLPQELRECDGIKTVYEFLSEEEMFWNCTPKELSMLSAKLGVSFELFYSDQKMKTLSGGERIKIEIAKIMIQHATVLLLDEPSNDLDIETVEWLEEWILSWKGIVLFVSHDETLIERTANVIIHLEQLDHKSESRSTVERVSYAEYVDNRNKRFHNLTRIAAGQKREEQKEQERLRRVRNKVEHQLRITKDSTAGRLLAKKMKSVKSMEKRYEREREDGVEAPETEDAMFVLLNSDSKVPANKRVLSVQIDELKQEDRVLSRNIKLNIMGAEKIGIVGKNGAGKSTLLKILYDMLSKREDLEVSYMPQNYIEMLPMEKMPVEFLAEDGDKEECDKIRTYLGSMKFTYEEMTHKIAELSGGQKGKLLLLKLSLSNASVLLLDEPTRNFSALSAPVFRKVLRGFGGVIISVSHDRKYLEEVCDKVYSLEEGGLFLKEFL